MNVDDALHLARCRFGTDPHSLAEAARALADEVDRLNAVVVRQGLVLAGQLAASSVPEVTPLHGGGACDWGGCSDDSTAQRWSPEAAAWLPVCAVHEVTP